MCLNCVTASGKPVIRIILKISNAIVLSNKKRWVVSSTSLESFFSLIMAAEAVETSPIPNSPLEITNTASSFKYRLTYLSAIDVWPIRCAESKFKIKSGHANCFYNNRPCFFGEREALHTRDRLIKFFDCRKNVLLF